LKTILLLISLFTQLLYAEFSYKVENTNFTISQSSPILNADKRYLYNYDRLRFRGDYTHENFFSTIIFDGVNYLGEEYVNSNEFEYIKRNKSDTPFKTQSTFHEYDNGALYTKLYRLYGGYEDNNNRVVLGLQNISMGVGRIWTPTNLFNPTNVYALEPDETFGVAAFLYTKHLNDTSDLTFVVSQDADNNFKYALRYKAFFDFAEIGINVVNSSNTKMIGYEIEGNLADTGIELRSEGAYIKNNIKTTPTIDENIKFFQGILGADYAFVNGITVIAEALYSSKTFSLGEMLLNYDSDILPNLVFSNFYTALSFSYSFNIFLDGSLVYIESFNDKNSRFLSPTLSYTLNDYNSFMIGAMIQDGNSGSEFGESKNTYYFKWLLSF